ncbi:type I addiction module toxin, SymE family, partial [Xanthomonas hortorum pv. gardneri]
RPGGTAPTIRARPPQWCRALGCPPAHVGAVPSSVAAPCTVGYGYYPASDQRIPTLRLRGRWLEQLGFAIGSKLHIRLRDGELVVSVAPTD